MTLSELPPLVRKHPPNWSYYKSMHSPPTLSTLAMESIDKEIVETDVKRRDAFRNFKAKRAASMVKQYQYWNQLLLMMIIIRFSYDRSFFVSKYDQELQLWQQS